MFDINLLSAKLTNINVRREGDEDSAVVAIDLKIEASAAANYWLDRLLGVYPGTAKAHLWDETTKENEPRFISAGYIPTNVKIMGVHFKLGKIRPVIGELKGFSFRPRTKGIADLVFSVSLNPEKGLIEAYSNYLKESSVGELKMPLDLFDTDPAHEAEDEDQIDLEESIATELENRGHSDLAAKTRVRGGDGIRPATEKKSFNELLPWAAELVVEAQSASRRMLKEKLGVGSDRADELLDTLAKAGVVSHAEPRKQRKVIVTELTEEMLGSLQ